jgi:hypothetical protein
MFFVHVVAGTDLLVSIAQFEGQIRITLQIRRRWNFIERREREYFTGDLEDQNVVAEWCALVCTALAQAIFAKAREVHSSRNPRRKNARQIVDRDAFLFHGIALT